MAYYLKDGREVFYICEKKNICKVLLNDKVIKVLKEHLVIKKEA